MSATADGIQYMCGPEVDHCRMDEITDDEDCEYSESEWSSTPIAEPKGGNDAVDR